MKFINKLLSSVLSILMVTTCLNVGVVADDSDDTAKESEQTDYSSLIKNELSYSEDKSTATLVVSIDTEDDVYLDIVDDDSFQELYDEGKLAVNEEQTSSKSLAFNIAANGDYTFVVEVYDSNNQKLASKEVTASVTELTETGGVDTEYKAQEATNITATIKVDDKNAQDIVYYKWNRSTSASDSETGVDSDLTIDKFTKISSSTDDKSFTWTETWSDWSVSGYNAYVLFFIKPNAGYLFTGLNADGLGQYWVVGSGTYTDGSKGISEYPGLSTVMKVAQDAGYVAVFGYERLNGQSGTVGCEINTEQPVLTVDASKAAESPTPIDGYDVGDIVIFDVKLTPSVKATNATMSSINVTKACVNDVDVSTIQEDSISDITESSDGTYYTAKITHKITNADIAANKIELKVDANVTYTISITSTGTQKITTKSTVAEEGTHQLTGQNVEVNTPSDYVYDGQSHKWTPTITDPNKEGDDKTLVEGTDYEVTYSTTDFTNVNDEITVTITGKGNYASSTTRTYKITKRPVSFLGNSDTLTYNGAKQTVSGFTDNSTGKNTGLVTGHVATITATASRTDVGTNAGTITDANDVKIKTGEGDDATDVTSNYSISTTAGSITITAKQLDPDTEGSDFTVSNPTNYVYDGSEHKFVPVVTYKETTLSENTDYTVSYSTTDFTSANDQITVTITGQGNYSGTVTKTYAISKRAIEFIGNSGTYTYTGSEQSVNGYTLSTAEGKYALVSGQKVKDDTLSASASATNVGTTTGSISNASDVKIITDGGDDVTANYNITTAPGSITINAKGIVGVTVENPSNVVYNGSSQQQKPVVYSSTDKTTKLIEGTDYTLSYEGQDTTNVGTVTVTINGIGNYSGSTTTTYQITKRPIKITGDSATKEYTGSEQKVNTYKISETTDSSGLVSGQRAEIKYAATGTNVNSEGYDGHWYEIKFFAGDVNVTKNYEIDSNAGKLIITAKAINNVDVNSPTDSTYDGDSHKWEPTVTSGSTTLRKDTDYTVSYVIKNSDGTTTPITEDDFKNATTSGKEILVTITGTNNYSGTVTRTYKISKKDVTITVENDSKVYGTDDPTFKAPTVTGLVKDTDLGTISVKRNNSDVNDAGKYTGVLDATYSENSNYNVNVVKGNFEITAKSIDSKDVTISEPSNSEYDGKEHKFVPTVTYNNKNLTEGTDYTVTYTVKNSDGEDVVTTDFTNVTGEITVTITGKENSNFTGTVTKKYQITPKAVTITVADDSKVYGTDDPTFKAPTVTGLVKDTDLGTVEVVRTNKDEDADIYPEVLDATYTSNSNYNVTVNKGDFEITAQSINPDDKEKGTYSNVTVNDPSNPIYDGDSHKWEPTVTSSDGKTLLEKDKDYTVSYAIKNSDGTTTPITEDDFKNATASGKEILVTITGTNNYSGTVTKTYKITPKALKITTNSGSKVYDGKALTAEGTIEGIVDGETYTFNTTGYQLHKGESDNGYELKFDGTAKESNYSIVEDDVTIGTLKVTAQSVDPKDDDGTDDSPYKGIKVTPPADTTYNGKNQELKPTVTDSNGKVLEEGKDYTIKYSDDTKNAGTVTVEITGIGDYSGTVETSYKINKVDVTITTGGGEKTYDGSPLTNSDVKITGDIVDGEIIKITATGSQTEVGESDNTYEITWGDDVNKDNYNIIPSYGKLVVKKKDEPSSKVVTCEEYMHSKDWTWSETKKACVYKVSNTSSK